MDATMRSAVVAALLLVSPAFAQDELPWLSQIPADGILVQLVVERIDEQSGPVAVPPEYGFHVGERVRFEVHANRGGYWAVAERDGEKLVRVWPKEAGGQPVQAGRWTLIPADAKTVEDRTLRIVGPGADLVLLFSPEPLTTPETRYNETPNPRWLRQVRLRGNVEVDKNPVPSKPVCYFQGEFKKDTTVGIAVLLRHEG